MVLEHMRIYLNGICLACHSTNYQTTSIPTLNVLGVRAYVRDITMTRDMTKILNSAGCKPYFTKLVL